MLRSHKKTILEALGRKPIHPFPARMAPGIALEALGERKALRVLDPMAGSGTVLAVARSKGHEAIGLDVDPLSVLLARVWTRTVAKGQCEKKAREVLLRAKQKFKQLSPGAAYPQGSDEETRKFIRYWFDDYARRQLWALASVIGRVRDEGLRELLWSAFSRLIIAKSVGASRAMDLAHSRPHRKFDRAPVKPFNRFLSAVRSVVANCPQPDGAGEPGPVTDVRLGDARAMEIKTGSIDLVLTSPPYLNAIDYMRCSKFSLVWMGYSISELREIRAMSVGTEASSREAMTAEWVGALIRRLRLSPTLPRRHHSLLAQYVWDMGRAVGEASRVLRAGGRAVYVVGDSTVRGTFVGNSRIVTAIAKKQGLRFRSRHSRLLPANRRYMPPPKRDGLSRAMDARMRREVVLVFEKPLA